MTWHPKTRIRKLAVMALLALSRRWSLLSFPSFTIYYYNKALASKSHIQSNKVHHPCTFICPFHNYRSASRTYLLCCSQVFMYYFDNAIFLFPIFVCSLYSYTARDGQHLLNTDMISLIRASYSSYIYSIK